MNNILYVVGNSDIPL